MALTAAAARNALIAFNRFGLGARPDYGPADIGNPKLALRAEIRQPGIAHINDPSMPDYAKACSEAVTSFEVADGLRIRELNARVAKQMNAPIGFVERLVMFWSNHFSMIPGKGNVVRGTIGQWERDVVRKNVLGKFEDMLLGTIRHPAMLAYLDNDDSVGPNAPVGQKWHRGFNENLAREIMELHTIGSLGGYSETDVTAFARILTGWSFVRRWEAEEKVNGGNATNRGQFIYRSDWHEPGAIALMGKSYGALGQAQAEAVLKDLAHHPKTAEHIAFKLVHHFITDEPTAAMVDPLKTTFTSTGGDLRAVALALINLPEAWSTPLHKIRTPQEMTIAQYRAIGRRHDDDEFWAYSGPLNALQNMVWQAGSPQGFSDDTETWLNPDAMRIRIDTAQFVSRRFAWRYPGNVLGLGLALFETALSADTRGCIRRAADSNEALTILLCSPEFQRR